MSLSRGGKPSSRSHSIGLGAIWRTKSAAYDPAVKSFLGISKEQHVIGLVYVGNPSAALSNVFRHSFEDRTVWLD